MKPQLLKIKAHLENLLADAKLRTAGKWIPSDGTVWDASGDEKICGYTEYHDARYITSCAGNAEAGWRSTLVAIDFALRILDCFEGCKNHPLQERELEVAKDLAQSIIAEWEGLV